MSQLGDAILSHYVNQQQGRGEAFQVFRGGDYQYGNGIGDIFRSIGRFLLPILTGTAGGFIGSAAQGLSEGKSLKEAAMGAVKPTIGSAVESTSSAIMKKVSGGGRRRRRGRAAKGAANSLYKGQGKRKRKSASKKRTKRIRFLPTNF